MRLAQGNRNHWIYPALGNLKIPDITPANISALLLSMQSQGKAHATCVKVYTIAYMSDVVPVNPTDKVERIFAALENEPLKWRVLMRLLIDTGIRWDECCELQ